MYNPEMGRFMQRDPYGTIISPTVAGVGHRDLGTFIPRESYNPHLQYAGGMNLYEYVGSSPTAYVDPSGMIQWKWPIRGRAINESKDRCAIVWSDHDGPWKGFQVLQPGDDTGNWKDQNDHIYFNGNWYKNRSRTVYIGGRDDPYRKSAAGNRGNNKNKSRVKIPLDPVQKDDDTKAPGKPGWNSLPSEEICRQYCECNNKARNPTDDCEDVEDCVKKCRDPWG